jgi:hypothetical protein
MPLELTVGILAQLARDGDDEGAARYAALFELVGDVLAGHGLPRHDEPAGVEPYTLAMYGNEGIHSLRRVAAYLAAGRPVPPPAEEERRPAHLDDVVRAYYTAATRNISTAAFPHLMLHSDAEGVYVPAELPAVVIADPALELEGGAIGSAAGLEAECLLVADALHAPLALDPDGDELWDAAHGVGSREGWRRHGVECFTCLRLLALCRHSRESGAATVLRARLA